MPEAAKSDNYTIVSAYLEYRINGSKRTGRLCSIIWVGELGYTNLVS